MNTILAIVEYPLLFPIVQAALLVTAGLIVAALVARTAFKVMLRYLGIHHSTLFKRLLYWLVLSLFLASALRQMGFSLGVLLGAAGVLSVAIGFASQTSASNLISGLFLVGEKPFELGDYIKVGETIGEVLFIDLLSVKLRTLDNLYVRIPNESLIKTEVTNLTRFPIRRFDMQVRVGYQEDIAKVREVLLSVADGNPLALDDPTPLILLNGFGESSLNIQFSVWAKRESYRDLRNSLYEDVKNGFDAAGIEFPLPKRTLYAGRGGATFPVQTVPMTQPTESTPIPNENDTEKPH